MARFCALTTDSHEHRRWQRCSSYKFAGADTVAALVAHELGKACTSMPLAFIWRDEQFLPVALLGVERDKNLFVASDGRWLGRYIPAAYRSYPFALGKTDDGQMVLCIDENSGLMMDHQSVSADQVTDPLLRFYLDNGEPDPSVLEVLSFLEKTHRSQAMTQRICSALNSEALLVPWVFDVKTPGGNHHMEGLYRIDESKLQALSAESLYRLNQTGALSAAYCQLVSMHNINQLSALALLHHSAESPSHA